MEKKKLCDKEQSDKENIKKNLKTKMPLEPLPALPEHSLGHKTILGDKRRPLKTLMDANSVLITSKGKVLDTRNVTVRPPRQENLDWNYEVFRDVRKQSINTISDHTGSSENSEVKFFDKNHEKNCFGERLESTPGKSLLEPKGVTNIKRSLERPHSKELQGLSPAPKHEKVDERVKTGLQFNERLQDRLSSPDYWNKLYAECITRDYADDLSEYLLTVERKPLAVPNIASITRSYTRANNINWMLKLHAPDSDPAIVQSACWFLNSILGVSYVPSDNLQLAAAACYWIAKKLHGPAISAKNLLKRSGHAFSARKLIKAEKMILENLKFPVQPVVPQEFITYLSWWCDNEGPGEIEMAATFLCLSGLMVETRLCEEEYPSVIAVASVRNALLLLGKRDLMKQLEMSSIYKTAQKKTANISSICSVLRRAVRIISNIKDEYKAPLAHYNLPPYYIAQRITNAAKELVDIDSKGNPKTESGSIK